MRVFVLLLVLLVGPVLAEEGELRLDVTGEIAIDKDGSVYDYEISTIVTPEIKQIVEGSVRQWRFEPVLRDGKAVYAKSHMYLTLAALPVGKGYQLRIDKVLFAGNRSVVRTASPDYPREAQRVQIDAYVLVALQVDAAGKVLDAIATQSELPGKRGSERAMNGWKKLFETASVKAAKQWRFQPADLAAGDVELTTLIIPISFTTGDRPSATQGWRASSPASKKPIPWLSADKQHYDASGLKSGQSLALDHGIKLKTDIVGTTL